MWRLDSARKWGICRAPPPQQIGDGLKVCLSTAAGRELAPGALARLISAAALHPAAQHHRHQQPQKGTHEYAPPASFWYGNISQRVACSSCSSEKGVCDQQIRHHFSCPCCAWGCGGRQASD